MVLKVCPWLAVGQISAEQSVKVTSLHLIVDAS